MSQYERNKRWKEKNREKVNANQQRYRKDNGKDTTKESRQNRMAKLKDKLEQFMQDKECIECGENRRICLCFHHRDPSTKKMQIPQMVCHCYAWKTILAEIDKCDILCHNCHAINHYG